MEERIMWYWVIIGLAVLCISIEAIRVWYCYQDPCCELHWLVLNKEAICPVMAPYPSGTLFV